MATVCSQCAAMQWSAVITVQPLSRSTYVFAPAFVSVIIGSMAIVMPGFSTSFVPGLP